MRRRFPATFLVLCSFVTISCQAEAVDKTPEQAVIVHFNYGSTDLGPLFALEAKLEHAIATAGVGEYDGHEIATDGSDGYLYMYGPDADRLFETVRSIFESATFMRGAKITNRYGLPEDGIRESTFTIAP